MKKNKKTIKRFLPIIIPLVVSFMVGLFLPIIFPNKEFAVPVAYIIMYISWTIGMVILNYYILKYWKSIGYKSVIVCVSLFTIVIVCNVMYVPSAIKDLKQGVAETTIINPSVTTKSYGRSYSHFLEGTTSDGKKISIQINKDKIKDVENLDEVSIYYYKNMNWFYKVNEDIKDIEYLKYTITALELRDEKTYYEIIKQDDKYIINQKPAIENAKETNFELPLDSELIKRIKDVLNNYEVYKWDGFDKVDKNARDGSSWDLVIKYDGKEIHAKGYYKYPKNYDKVKKRLHDLFMKVY